MCQKLILRNILLFMPSNNVKMNLLICWYVLYITNFGEFHEKYEVVVSFFEESDESWMCESCNHVRSIFPLPCLFFESSFPLLWVTFELTNIKCRFCDAFSELRVEEIEELYGTHFFTFSRKIHLCSLEICSSLLRVVKILECVRKIHVLEMIWNVLIR